MFSMERFLLTLIRWGRKNRHQLAHILLMAVFFAMPMTVVFSIDAHTRGALSLMGVFVALAISFLGGVIVGLATWHTYFKRLHK